MLHQPFLGFRSEVISTRLDQPVSGFLELEAVAAPFMNADVGETRNMCKWQNNGVAEVIFGLYWSGG